MNNSLTTELIKARSNILKNITANFDNKILESHLLGSLAKNKSDAYSDIDIWITINDEYWDAFVLDRENFFSKIGTVLHFCEPPQNAPVNGLFSSVFYKTGNLISIVDFYFSPSGSSFKTIDSKNIFGVDDLPFGELSLNPQPKPVPESYRIDFFICFIFGTIKKILRRKEDAMDLVLQQYKKLKENHFPILPELSETEYFKLLNEIINNTKLVVDKKQINVLQEIELFIDLLIGR